MFVRSVEVSVDDVEALWAELLQTNGAAASDAYVTLTSLL